jgi:hypothetical protein
MGGVKFSGVGAGVAVLGADQGISIDPITKLIQLGAGAIADANLGVGEISGQRFLSLLSTELRYYLGGTTQDQYISFDGSVDLQGRLNLFGNNGSLTSPKLVFTVPTSPDVDYKIFNDGSQLVFEATAGNNRLIAFSQANDLMTISKNVDGQGRQQSGFRSKLSNKTAAYPVTIADYPGILTNSGAAGSITFTLPLSVVGGEQIYFYQRSAFEIVLDAGAGRLIRNGAVTGQTWRTNTVGNGCLILGLGANLWGMFPNGIWTTP